MSTVEHAVILAAGKSSKFFPPLYDKPKGLFVYKGEVLIERQIRQLREAGVSDISVVVGYEKEHFFYLRDAWQVNLIVSVNWANEGSMASLELAQHVLRNGAFVCAADHWFAENPFPALASTKDATRMIQNQADATQEFVVDANDEGRLLNMRNGAPSGTCMIGAAYFSPEFSDKLMSLWSRERTWVGARRLFWEQFWGQHADELPLYGVSAVEGYQEFDSLGDFGTDGVLGNMDQNAVANICRLLTCEPSEVTNVNPLNAGLTNVSFSFTARGTNYVYRHPGASSSALVNRQAEVTAQRCASDLDIDYSVIDISPEGWKLSRFIPSSRKFSYDNQSDLVTGIAQIRQLHQAGVACDHIVDLLHEGDRLLTLASMSKSGIEAMLQEARRKVERVWHHIELDKWPRVLCHNDIYAVNWIAGPNGPCLIDWEYAGMGDPMGDLATMPVRDSLPQGKYDEIIALYFEGMPTFEQKRHAYGMAALCGWYWTCWSLFKDTLGEDGYFMLSSWEALNHYSMLALQMYEGESR